MSARLTLLSLLIVALVTVGATDNTTGLKKKDIVKRYVSRGGKVLNVTLHWASDPARAASALFAAVLRSALGYQDVYLRQSPYLDLGTLAEKVPHDHTRQYDEVILALSLAWEPRENFDWAPNRGAAPGLAGPRLEEFGASSIPVRQRLHVHVAKHLRARSECLNVTQWSFYTNVTALKLCGFTDIVIKHDQMKHAVIYELDSVTTTMTKLEEFAEALNFDFKNFNRTQLFQMLRTSQHSFLFIDYDIWSRHPNVSTILQPFCLPSAGPTCYMESSSAVAMRVGDLSTLIEFGPELLLLAHKFRITVEAIREILELESERKHIDDAVNEWILKNDTLLKWARKEYSDIRKFYDVIICYCKDDPNGPDYDQLLKVYFGTINKMYKSMFRILPLVFDADCSDVNDIKNKLNRYLSLAIKQRLIGVIVGSVNNITHVAKTVEDANVPVMYYDAMGIDVAISSWQTSGRSRHLALALRHFILKMNRARVAVLSEPTVTARRFVGDLIETNKPATIAFGDHLVPLNLSTEDAMNVLQALKEEDAHIIYVNSNYKDAATVLAAAARLEMSSTKNYTWIVRDWRPNSKTANIRHFTLSFWCRCSNDVPDNEGLPELRRQLDKFYPDCSWPPHAATLGDALLTLVNGFKTVLLKYPYLQNDLRNHKAIQALRQSISNVPIQGVTQNLTYKGNSLEETVIFVDEWYGARHNHLARWRVNEAKSEVLVDLHQRVAYPLGDQPGDGSSSCYVPSGDAYLPYCHDWEWITAVVFIILMIPSLIWIYRYLRHRLKEHENKIICQILAQRRQRAAALSANYLVDRSAISLRYELGSGRFGFVRLAWLRLPGRTPQVVAAKALRNNQDESEILHEACLLASLNHENIVRLVGVCIDKDPPLVLMEVVFFGDLLQYLRSRRYLVEGVHFTHSNKVDETNHVSAEALTRLARQAASALAYLAMRGVIHRDVRASNCLVDANRSLKLADFGLARETVSTDRGAEYACRRRGLFPVLWMAPESLVHGVFSAASDVWALGVLVFELVTLGARPFGDMSPLRVMQCVAAGGKLMMPKDATPHTIALTRLCWQRDPEERPTAANVVAYLAERPHALRPALDGDDEQPVAADSGCGESPMSEFLPC